MTRHEHRNGLDQVAQHISTSEGNWQEILELLAEHGFEGMAQAMQMLFDEAMKLERSAVLEAQPCERTARRRGYANGFKPKTVQTRIGELELAVPQARDVAFYPSALERGQRRGRALKLAVAEMYLQGVSTRKVTAVMEELCGFDVTSMQVSRAVQALDEELTKWRNRPLGEIPYLLLDARYEKVRVGGAVVSCALLIAAGITPDGQRTILGVSVSLSEAEVHWRAFLASLQTRGAVWRADGHQRRPRRPEGGARCAASRRAVAALPVPLGGEPPGARAQPPVGTRRQRRVAERL